MAKKRVIPFAILFALACLTAFFVCVAAQLSPNSTVHTTITDTVLTFSADEAAVLPDGTTQYTIYMPAQPQCTSLVFFSNHQAVRVEMDGLNVYSYLPKGGVFGRTTGSAWNFVYTGVSAGHTLEVSFTPVYPGVVCTAPIFYAGRSSNIYRLLLQMSIPVAVLCILISSLGLVMLLYWLVVARRAHNGSLALVYLGSFALIVGLWCLNETDFTALFLPNRPACTVLAFYLLMLMPIPFLLHVRETVPTRNDWLWQLLCAGCLINLTVCTVLQLAGIADLRQTCLFTHILVMVSALYPFAIVLINVRRFGLHDREIRVQLISLLVLALGCSLDLITYYLNLLHTDILGCVSFFIYILLLGFLALENTLSSIQRGEEVEVYRRMAFLDSLTFTYSRAAYDDDLQHLYKLGDGYCVFALDLNNLKQHNDSFGHAAGDNALRRSSVLLRSVFGGHGRCYRVGGDEFCAVCKADSIRPDTLIARLRHAEDTENITAQRANLPPIHLACGYAVFDPAQDKTLEDTRARADVLLYHDKQVLKKQGL